MLNRKDFISQILLSAGVGLTWSGLNRSYESTKFSEWIKPNQVILFQGDSITDAGRNKDQQTPNIGSALGQGYASLVTSQLLFDHPTFNLKCYNKGISGHKVPQLQARWKEDCLDLEPQILSILIGVNDYWHKLNHGYEGNASTYFGQYKKLIDTTLQSLPTIQLIIGEPFAIPGIQAVNQEWFPEFNEYREAAKTIAQTYKAKWIPYQSIFEEASKVVAPSYWTYDGVHTTLAGAQLMAEAWLETARS
jgi:lysophospholipase L1-like esterase